MAGLGKAVAGQQEPQGGLAGALQGMWDEATGAFARYGRRSGAQRDASLAMLNQAVDPNTDPLTGAGMKALGLAGLVTHPLAFFPTREEWDQRLEAAGNTGRMSRSIGGFLSDLPSLIDPQMAAGAASTAVPAIFAGMMAKTADLNKLKQAEKLAELGHSADDIRDMTGWFKGVDDKWRFEIPDQPSQMTRGVGTNARVGEVLSHDELYNAYPELRDMKAYGLGAREEGMYLPREAPSGEAVFVGDNNAHSTLLHELQHAIQEREGFSAGANLKPKPSAKDVSNYKRSAGEVEARNVQTRMSATPEQLMTEAFAPWRTADYAPYHQIVERKAKKK